MLKLWQLRVAQIHFWEYKVFRSIVGGVLELKYYCEKVFEWRAAIIHSFWNKN